MNNIESDYRIIQNYIFEMLKNSESPLPSGAIEEKINQVKSYFKTSPLLAAQLISFGKKIELGNLSDNEYKIMEEEFKAKLNVAHERGIAVLGDRQKKRDNRWWHRYRKDNNLYYWNNYKKYIENELPSSSRIAIDTDTDEILSYLENPQKDESFERYGMVVGHVQSGKTGNYAALISKAADAGYKFIVVIAGGLNNLRNQTQLRINESFIGRTELENVGVGNFLEYDQLKTPVSLTTSQSDFTKRDADLARQAFDLDMGERPVVLVIKKHSSTLTNVIEWINSKYNNNLVKKHAMLVIDDESDYASINTKKEDSPTAINKKIRELLALFDKKCYVAYTATPYANIFIDPDVSHEELGKDLFPEDFIYGLDAPSNYFGAAKIFLDNDKKYLTNIKDYEETLPTKHKSNWIVDFLPESLLDAIRLFIINIAIRHLRKQDDKHNSMMIHVTRFTAVHEQVFVKVALELERLVEVVGVFGGMPQSEEIMIFKKTFDKQHKNKIEFSWEEVLEKISEVITKIDVKAVHNNSKSSLKYDDKVPNNYIVVGGTSLARGYTLEGLSVSYFLRSTIMFDTLMQMGRWFGYRNNYEDLCKIYIPSLTSSYFSSIIESTIDLMNELKEMNRYGKTPKDFGLAVKYHPDSALQVTARNKLKHSQNIVVEVKLDGHLKETNWLDSDGLTVENNLKVMRILINNLPSENKNITFKNNNKEIKNTIWYDINKNTIQKFLEDFKCHENTNDMFGIHSRMPIEFIKKYAEEINTNWDVVLYTGKSDETIVINDEVYGSYQFRNINLEKDRYEFINRQVSSGNAEEATLTKKDIEEIRALEKEKQIQKDMKEKKQIDEIDQILKDFASRKEARKRLKKPLLMLHLIKADINVESVKQKDRSGMKIAAFGISFPASIKSESKNIKLKVNKVYLEQLANITREESEFDDAD